jgi:tRNA (cmo5U34)-methyltransferase
MWPCKAVEHACIGSFNGRLLDALCLIGDSTLRTWDHSIMTNGTDRFDQVAGTWDANSMRVALATAVAAEIERQVGLTRTMDVLDFGCGTGLVTLALAPQVRTVTGADSSEGMLAVLEEKVRSQHLASVRSYLVTDSTPLSGAGRFDLITSSMALHHVHDVAALVAQFWAMLLPRGQIAIADLDTEDGTFHEAGVSDVHHRGFDRLWLRQLLSQHGFVGLRDTTAFVHQRNGRDYPVFLIAGTLP